MEINKDRINLIIELEGKEINVREKFKVDIKSAEETINQDLKEQAPLFAWYAVMYELANEIYEEAESLIREKLRNYDRSHPQT